MKRTLFALATLGGLTPVAHAVTVSANIVGYAGASGTLDSSDLAGLVPASNWNQIEHTGNDISVSNLVDSTGAPTALSVSWVSIGPWYMDIGTSNDQRLFNGYLDNFDEPRTITFSGFEAGTTYQIYLYIDGDNGTHTRHGEYTLGGVTTTVVDAPGNFSGSYEVVAAGTTGEGNATVFTVSGATSYDLVFHGDLADDLPRAPLNAFQIVSVPEPSGGVLALLSFAGFLHRRRK
ncbi:hypothetical protein HNR46_000457 [Haloferula luteola]|uniref:PEP-CTERM sorting domain-containing protein n=2 Tax=Haloferula luteola TaxID=595692 RepID=A0A840UZ05_9BACT|nr:hypothetical protein [Haloferula luteola]